MPRTARFILASHIAGSEALVGPHERLERLILVMAVAMYWAVSCGAAEARKAAQSGEKGGFENA